MTPHPLALSNDVHPTQGDNDRPAGNNNALLILLEAFADEGLLRRLGPTFARFITALAPANAQTASALTISVVILSELEGRGHSCLNLADLVDDPCALLGWRTDQWASVQEAAGALPTTSEAWHSALSICVPIWDVHHPDSNQPLVLDQQRLYLRRYWRNEMQIAESVKVRTRQTRDINAAQVRHWLDRLFDTPSDKTAPDWQKIACAIAIRSTFSIITGGPGTGKTYTVARLLALLFALSENPTQLRIGLAAPTGKAAARLKQSIDEALGGLAEKVGDALPLLTLAANLPPASTLHSLLGARPDTRALRHHAGNPLQIDVLIVDEASMIHLEMMADLLAALPPTTMVILLGDKDQLASVEAGAVLGDLCHTAELGGYSTASASYVAHASGQTIPAAMLGNGDALAQQTVMLRQSRRFSGPIGVLAQAVNAGDATTAIAVLHAEQGQQKQQENVLQWLEHARLEPLLQLAEQGRAGAFGGYRTYLSVLQEDPRACAVQQYETWVHRVLTAFDGFRILCAVREGDWGVAGINQALAQYFEKQGYLRRRGEWYVGRPVMVTRNDYGIGVFNGDIGITLPDPLRQDALRVYFLQGDSVRSVMATRLANVETSFAMTVHKSQGSEFKHVVMVLPVDSGQVVTQELVYTGITRARENFTLVTPLAAVLEQAIEHKTRRASGLKDNLIHD